MGKLCYDDLSVEDFFFKDRMIKLEINNAVKKATVTAIALGGFAFRSGTLGESMTRNPNWSRFLDNISRSTSWP